MNSKAVDKVTPQYQHIKELSQLKYDAEEKREQNLIQQASQMQTVFSFITAAVFMAVPVCIQYRGKLSLKFFFLSISLITAFILSSLVLASIAQWRWKTKTFPDIEVIKKSILDSPEWEKNLDEYNRIDQWINLVAIVQKDKARLNDRRVKLIIASMICFFCSVVTIAISFIIAVSIMI
jgi:hypothetical protein